MGLTPPPFEQCLKKLHNLYGMASLRVKTVSLNVPLMSVMPRTPENINVLSLESSVALMSMWLN